MITIDSAVGSREFLERLQPLHVPCRLGNLEFGDFSFLGNGPEGRPVPVGVERKTIEEVISCVNGDTRFVGHQLPGLLASYEWRWLVVEGYARTDHDGLVESYSTRARSTLTAINHWLFTIAIQGGLQIVTTKSEAATADWLKSLYTWWTAKEWDEHGSLKVIYQPQSRGVHLVKPTLVRQFAALLPGIGWEKSARVVERFKTPEGIFLATAEDWMTVEGIGEKTAWKIVETLKTGLLAG